MGWWLQKSTLFQELFSLLICLATSYFVIAKFGLFFNQILLTENSKLFAWSLTGFVILKIIFSLSTTLAKEFARLKKMVIRDTLTGLYNKAFLAEAIEISLTHAKRSNESFCVFVLDGNSIKYINDTYGHESGDMAIKKIAQTLEKVIYRRDDLLIRWGGDEFIILCSSTDPQKMYARMLENFNNEKIMTFDATKTKTLILRVAIGFASKSFSEKANKKIEAEQIYKELFYRADKMMLEEKAAMKKFAAK